MKNSLIKEAMERMEKQKFEFLDERSYEGCKDFVSEEISNAVNKVIGEIESLHTGHKSYSCTTFKNGKSICVCGADEDRWNLAINDLLSTLKENQ